MDDIWGTVRLSPTLAVVAHATKVPVAFVRAAMAETALLLLFTRTGTVRGRFLLVWTIVDFFLSQTDTLPFLSLVAHMIGIQAGAVMLGTPINPLETAIALAYTFLYFFYVGLMLIFVADITP